MGSSDVEQIIDSVYALLDGPVTAVGRRELATHAGPNRIVAIPLGAPEISLPTRPGDARFSDKGRQLLLRHFRIDWECHGVRAEGEEKDFKAAEDLFKSAIIAVRTACHHSVSFADEIWSDQQEGNDGFERYGSVIVFTSIIQIPIYEPRGGTTTLTATPPIVTTATLNGNTES